jgi:hypothetical protein
MSPRQWGFFYAQIEAPAAGAPRTCGLAGVRGAVRRVDGTSWART